MLVFFYTSLDLDHPTVSAERLREHKPYPGGGVAHDGDGTLRGRSHPSGGRAARPGVEGVCSGAGRADGSAGVVRALPSQG
jgi:hypothetical protein